MARSVPAEDGSEIRLEDDNEQLTRDEQESGSSLLVGSLFAPICEQNMQKRKTGVE